MFGHSWGTIVATLFAASKPPGNDDHSGNHNHLVVRFQEWLSMRTSPFNVHVLPSPGLRTVVLGGALASSKVYIDAQWDPEEGNLGTLPIAMQVSSFLVVYESFMNVIKIISFECCRRQSVCMKLRVLSSAQSIRQCSKFILSHLTDVSSHPWY